MIEDVYFNNLRNRLVLLLLFCLNDLNVVRDLQAFEIQRGNILELRLLIICMSHDVVHNVFCDVIARLAFAFFIAFLKYSVLFIHDLYL